MIQSLFENLRSRRVRFAIVVCFALATASLGAPAARAQWGYPGPNRGSGYAQSGNPYQYAASSGYRHGYDHGANDRNRRKSFDVRRDDDYEDADRGYDRGLGISKDEFRRAFRAGYERGYSDGYYGRSSYGNRRTYNRPYRF